MEHLQSEEPFSSDSYFSAALLAQLAQKQQKWNIYLNVYSNWDVYKTLALPYTHYT